MYTNNLIFLQLCLTIQPIVKEMYLVGGCVRDMLLNLSPKDLDLVVQGDIDLIEETLRSQGWRVQSAGKQFLVLIVSKDNQQFEIAMYRKNGTYSDGRRPDFVEIGDIRTDAERRDLTINSLYMNPFTGEVLDPTSKGLCDLKNKVIRLNGNIKNRIKEDKLRIMRVYRFKSKFGFTIDPKTLKACRQYFGEMVKEVSSPRIMNEIEKMCGL